MLENVNDYLSLIVLIGLELFALRIFVGSIFGIKYNNPLLREFFNYRDNEDE